MNDDFRKKSVRLGWSAGSLARLAIPKLKHLNNFLYRIRQPEDMKREEEADRFAGEILIPNDGRLMCGMLESPRKATTVP